MKIVHGFTLPAGRTKVSDVELLALPEEEIIMMMTALSVIKYSAWKGHRMKKVLQERVDENDYSGHAQSRINFTARAMDFMDKFIDRFGKEK